MRSGITGPSQEFQNAFFLRVEDLCPATIGPFDSSNAARAHHDWAKNVRGDSSALVSINEVPPTKEDLEWVFLAPEDDRSWAARAANWPKPAEQQA